MKILLLGIFIVLFTGFAFAQTEAELTIKAARAIETTPTSYETIKQREHSLKWLIETNDVHLIVCGGVFDLFSDKKNKNASEMTAAYTIGMGAFKLEFPAKAGDEDAAQLAGLNTALKTYESLVKEKPKTKFEKIESLIQKRDSNELAGIVSGFGCGKK
jgi:hypothetical protein